MKNLMLESYMQQQSYPPQISRVTNWEPQKIYREIEERTFYLEKNILEELFL